MNGETVMPCKMVVYTLGYLLGSLLEIFFKFIYKFTTIYESTLIVFMIRID